MTIHDELCQRPAVAQGPIPSPDYTMRAGFSHEPLPNRNGKSRTDERITVLQIRLRVMCALYVLQFWQAELPDAPTEGPVARFIEEYLLAVQARRGTDECEYYARQEGVDVEGWKARIETVIHEYEESA